MNAYARSADAYLSQRILGASPEEQAALIMGSFIWVGPFRP